MGNNLPSVDVGGGVVTSIAAGKWHTCVAVNGCVKCWGHGGDGRLGTGATSHVGFYVSDMGANLPCVALGATLPVAEVGAGEAHSCARFADGSLKCWCVLSHHDEREILTLFQGYVTLLVTVLVRGETDHI